MKSRPPVILVHGIKDSARKMRHLAAYLEGEGWPSHACSLEPCNGSVGIDILAGQLHDYIDATLPAPTRFHLVGFSMGGLISRYYLQRLGGLDRVERFVTIATPHRGSLWAHLLSRPACRQMRPGSPFLRDLDTDADQLARVHFTSLWSPLDAIILPASHSVHPAAHNRRLLSPGHPLMVTQRHCLQAVADALRETET